MPKQLHSLADYCDRNKNWNIVLSNPCFEVWLFFHYRATIQGSSSNTCKEFKKEIATFNKSGYNRCQYIKEIITAINNAKKADSTAGHFFPNSKETKVYLLADALMKACSKTDFQRFINETIPRLIEEKNKK